MRPYSSLLTMIRMFAPLAVLSCAPTDTATKDESEPEDTGTAYVPPTDEDGDGVTPNDGDCDDEDATLYPGRGEDCDGIDNNCNGVVDEGLADADGDATADCMDVESCDGVDNDGDDLVDEGFADNDGNGVADCVGTEECDGLDNNENGKVDEGFDADSDGYTTCGTGLDDEDCDDADGDIFPGAGEVQGDGLDNDCNGLIDEGEWSSGDLAITELMNNPAEVLDPDGEWFEVVNLSGRELTLNGLVFESSIDGDPGVQVESDEQIVLGPDEFFVFGTNDDEVTNGGATVGYMYDAADLSLSNEYDELQIWAGPILVDEVAWDDGASMPDASGASIGTDQGNYGAEVNDLASNWCMATDVWGAPGTDAGSPGADNELCSTIDHDLDGFTGDGGDCDDADDTVYPGAFEGDPRLDNDCDGVVEMAPIAAPDYDATLSSLTTCSPLYLDGTNSYDPDVASSPATPITYSWELSGAPSGSATTTADIVDPTDASPIFHPDVAGTYTFTLTVNDGGTNSKPVALDVTITDRGANESPTANAGSDQSTTGSSTCTAVGYTGTYTCDDCSDTRFTLDGASSVDPDGDELTYSWSVTSGTSYGSIESGGSTSAPVILFTGAPAEYGVATETVVTIQLTVTDCFGATATDDVNVTYSCTGA